MTSKSHAAFFEVAEESATASTTVSSSVPITPAHTTTLTSRRRRLRAQTRKVFRAVVFTQHRTAASRNVYIAPAPIPAVFPAEIRGAVFLAGSIEMGKARNWQPELTARLHKHAALGPARVAVFNPRRKRWDSSWEQRARNPQFKEQVDWELDAQARADVIAMYFNPNTMSPITLLELGLFAGTGKLVVCCPDGYWRKGNVEVVCGRHNVEMVETFEDLVKAVIGRLVPDEAEKTEGKESQ